MNEDVERAAKAAYESWRKSLPSREPFGSWESLTPEARAIDIKAMRAAIEALREPTQETVVRMVDAMNKIGRVSGPDEILAGMTTVWRAAVDELLRD